MIINGYRIEWDGETEEEQRESLMIFEHVQGLDIRQVEWEELDEYTQLLIDEALQDI